MRLCGAYYSNKILFIIKQSYSFFLLKSILVINSYKHNTFVYYS